MPSEARRAGQLQSVVGILLAAGRGVRFDPDGGRNKLLQALSDETPVCVAAARLLTKRLTRVIAVVRPDAADVAAALKQAGCIMVESERAKEGMGASLADGVAASMTLAPDADGWLVALADMPFISADTVASVLESPIGTDGIAAPFHEGQRGHPVLFGAGNGATLGSLRGDAGARDLLASHPIHRVPVDDPGILRDIDRPADLET